MKLSKRDKKILKYGGTATFIILLLMYGIIPLVEYLEGINDRKAALEAQLTRMIQTISAQQDYQAGMEELTDSFVGPVAVAFGYGEIPDAARVLSDYIRTTKSILSIKSGFLEDRVLTSKDVETLATLPSKEVLISKVMAGIQSPIYGLVNVLAGPIRGMVGVLQARIQQLEGE